MPGVPTEIPFVVIMRALNLEKDIDIAGVGGVELSLGRRPFSGGFPEKLARPVLNLARTVRSRLHLRGSFANRFSLQFVKLVIEL